MTETVLERDTSTMVLVTVRKALTSTAYNNPSQFAAAQATLLQNWYDQCAERDYTPAEEPTPSTDYELWRLDEVVRHTITVEGWVYRNSYASVTSTETVDAAGTVEPYFAWGYNITRADDTEDSIPVIPSKSFDIFPVAADESAQTVEAVVTQE